MLLPIITLKISRPAEAEMLISLLEDALCRGDTRIIQSTDLVLRRFDVGLFQPRVSTRGDLEVLVNAASSLHDYKSS